MTFGPRRFNDTLALLVIVWILALFSYIVYAGIKVDAVGMIVGALIGWGGTILTFFYRKAPPEPPAGQP